MNAAPQNLEFDAELERSLQPEKTNESPGAQLRTERLIAGQTVKRNPNIASGAAPSLPRALLITAIILVGAVTGFFVWSRPKSSTPPATPAPERQISYSLTVQKMRDGREYEEPFESTGQEIFESGWKFKLNFNSPQPGYFYFLNDGPTSEGAIRYALLFPSPSINNGSAIIKQTRSIEAGGQNRQAQKKNEGYKPWRPTASSVRAGTSLIFPFYISERSHPMLKRICLLPYVICLGLTGFAQATDEVRPLEPGRLMEREIASGQRHLYRITLTAGQFMRAGVEPQGVNVTLTLIAPDGNQVATADFARFAGPESLSWEAAVAGDYRLVVSALTAAPSAGAYQARIEVKAAAADQDRRKVAIERMLAEANQSNSPGAGAA